jgi:hypothetical protein
MGYVLDSCVVVIPSNPGRVNFCLPLFLKIKQAYETDVCLCVLPFNFSNFTDFHEIYT